MSWLQPLKNLPQQPDDCDEETRRKPLVFAADAGSCGI
jgi:hypothetical protein